MDTRALGRRDGEAAIPDWTDEEELLGTNPQHRLGHKRRATTDDYMRGKRAKRVKPLPLRKAS
jgi:hypothetical protein